MGVVHGYSSEWRETPVEYLMACLHSAKIWTCGPQQLAMADSIVFFRSAAHLALVRN